MATRPDKRMKIFHPDEDAEDQEIAVAEAKNDANTWINDDADSGDAAEVCPASDDDAGIGDGAEVRDTNHDE